MTGAQAQTGGHAVGRTKGQVPSFVSPSARIEDLRLSRNGVPKYGQTVHGLPGPVSSGSTLVLKSDHVDRGRMRSLTWVPEWVKGVLQGSK